MPGSKRAPPEQNRTNTYMAKGMYQVLTYCILTFWKCFFSIQYLTSEMLKLDPGTGTQALLSMVLMTYSYCKIANTPIWNKLPQKCYPNQILHLFLPSLAADHHWLD